MRRKRTSIPVLLLLFCLVISGCNVPANSQAGVKVNAVSTSAARTLDAKLTDGPVSTSQPAAATDTLPLDVPTLEPLESATEPPAGTIVESAPVVSTPTDSVAASATLQPIATITNTPAPTAICDAAQFMDDVTIPDGTVVGTGQTFTKTWRFKNIGVCTWDSRYTLIFDVGDQINPVDGQTSLPLPTVAPGAEVELSVEFQAPTKSGTYRSYWRLRNPDGVMLPIIGGYKGKSFYVDIRVKENVSGVSANREFTVSYVDFRVTHSGTCALGTYTVSATLTGTGAGEVLYTWKRSDGTTDPLSDGTVTFPNAGHQTITYNWTTAATGISVMLVVIEPKQQEFGPALLNCKS